MRVAKTDVIAGLPAPVARSLVRMFRGRPVVQDAADRLLHDNGLGNASDVFTALEAAGYLEQVGFDLDDGYIWWETTTTGNALAMASFGKPISRKTADRLVSGLVERAAVYNAEATKPLFIDRLRIFGSYLQTEIDPLGDVDIELSYGRRITDPKTVSDYAKASGRTFNTYLDQLTWPLDELIQQLRNRSAAIKITTEDIDRLTDDTKVIYTIDDDSNAVPPPMDRRLVGRI